MFDDEELGEVDDLNSFSATLSPHDGLCLHIAPPPED
jgi:hypothetical protein